MRIQCNGCGAPVDVNVRTQSNVLCPYCGSSVKIEIDSCGGQASGKFRRIIPFVISEQDAIEIMFRNLVATEGVPVDVFSHIRDITVDRYMLPMYMLNGEIEAPWNATQVENRSRQVIVNGRYRTEYYNDKWPISGNAKSSYWLLSCANCKGELPYALREYSKVILYTCNMAAASISDRVKEIDYPLPVGCVEIDTDTDDLTVFNSRPVSDYLNNMAIGAARSQLPASYEHFCCTPRWTNLEVEAVGLSVYYVRFRYKGEVCEFCIDGVGDSYYRNFPIDHVAVKSLQKSIRKKRFSACLLLFLGILTPVVCTLAITPWPAGLLIAFIAMPFVMLTILLILIRKEWKALLANEEEQREFGRRRYLGLDTSDVREKANTKLRHITSTFLWTGLVVDIAAIVISLGVNIYRHSAEVDKDGSTLRGKEVKAERGAYGQTAVEVADYDNSEDSAEETLADKLGYIKEYKCEDVQIAGQAANEWLYGDWECRVVREVPNSYIGSVVHVYELTISETDILISVGGKKIYDGPYSIENDHIIYYLDDGSRKNIPIDRESHRLRLYGNNYYEKN